ncbi:hypothetical protein ACFQZC_37040 [Streptacidiphilus monticola]
MTARPETGALALSVTVATSGAAKAAPGAAVWPEPEVAATVAGAEVFRTSFGGVLVSRELKTLPTVELVVSAKV